MSLVCFSDFQWLSFISLPIVWVSIACIFLLFLLMSNSILLIPTLLSLRQRLLPRHWWDLSLEPQFLFGSLSYLWVVNGTSRAGIDERFFQSAQPWVPVCWSLLGTRLLCYCSHSLDLLLQGCGCQKEIKESWEVWYQLMYGGGSHLTTYHTYNPHRPNLP